MNTDLQIKDYVEWLPDSASNVTRQRLNRFKVWMDTQGYALHAPDLAAYRDALLDEGIAPTSARAYLGTVRSRYRELLRQREWRDMLYKHAGEALERIGHADTPANRFVFVNEAITRLENALVPEAARVKVATKQDHTDQEHLRLTKEQADALLAAPGTESLSGLRDTALIALLLCTGLREGEVVALNVADLRQRVKGELGLLVRHGKGDKARFIAYGALSWVLVIVDTWLKRAGIHSGAVFRPLRRGGHIRERRLTTYAVQLILARYPVVIDGRQCVVKPHDCRRTYAARQYAAGMDLNALRQNLGHADVKTTLRYIGTVDIEERLGRAVYSFDLRVLDKVAVQMPLL